jgi:serine/threonine-protein phosphatase PP1 catalytic subunit
VNRLLRQFWEGHQVARHWDIHFDAGDIRSLCTDAVEALRSDPIPVRVEIPVTVCGEIYRQFYDLLTIFQRCSDVPATNYLFLGDCVDRGYNSIETIKPYGFFGKWARRYQNDELWERFNGVFMYMPIAAHRIFCVHGGLSLELDSAETICRIARLLAVPSRGMLSDLPWSDLHSAQDGWGRSRRGTSQWTFGQEVSESFLNATTSISFAGHTKSPRTATSSPSGRARVC